MPTLYVMIGCPGLGKSTYVKNHLDENSKWVSRDEVRFSMVNENEPYFSKENDVYREFINRIDMNIENGYDVYADATHLNRNSRKKLFAAMRSHPDWVTAIWLHGSLERALAQNELRKGTRAYVPPVQLRKMYFAIQPPTEAEGFDEIEDVYLEG